MNPTKRLAVIVAISALAIAGCAPKPTSTPADHRTDKDHASDETPSPEPSSRYDTRSFDRYTATYDIHADGSIDVTIDVVFNFNQEPGHGIFLTYRTLGTYDDANNRVWDYTDITATSPSGAPADVTTTFEDDLVQILIGDVNVDDVSGLEEYVVTYTLSGALDDVWASELDSSIAPEDDYIEYDELFWNAIGTGWEIPIDHATIIVKGDAGVEQAVCFAGAVGSTDPCTSDGVSGGVATFTQDHLDPGEGVTIDVGFPAGSFDTTPILRPAADATTSWTGHGGG